MRTFRAVSRIFVALLVVVATLTSCGGDRGDDAAAVQSTSTPQPVCDPELDAAFAEWAAAGFSGSIALSTGGEFDCLASYGWANAEAGSPNTVDTVFSLGSVSKAFTAAAVLELVSTGKILLTDRVGDLIPELAGREADATVEQLLLHTSGLVGTHASDHEPLDRDAALAAIGRLERAFEPGSDFVYSNAGYTLLALIIEASSGMTYRDYMVSQVLPLPDGDVAGGFWDGEPAAPGPRAVGYHDDGPTGEMGDFGGPHWALDGNGDLAMTTSSLAAWTHALFTGHVVSPEAVELLTTLAFDQGDGTSETPGWVAYDESLFGQPFFATAGGGGDVGHNAVVVWVPDDELVIAIASNTPAVSAEELLRAIGPALVAGEPLPGPDAPARDVDPADLTALVGTYELESGGSLDVTATDDQLAIAANGADAIAALFPVPTGFTTDQVVAHENAVSALLAGETQEGREERELLESDVGTIADIEIVGTIVDDGELRTYVIIMSGSESTTLWYALDDQGGIAAAEITREPPTQRFVPSGSGRYRPDDPTGTGAEVTVEFDAGRMAVSSAAGTTVAELAA
jgi:CubicO group peptidase (beta-lactamase class C family)